MPQYLFLPLRYNRTDSSQYDCCSVLYWFCSTGSIYINYDAKTLFVECFLLHIIVLYDTYINNIIAYYAPWYAFFNVHVVSTIEESIFNIMRVIPA